jgi:hypothetical protein
MPGTDGSSLRVKGGDVVGGDDVSDCSIVKGLV